MTRRNKLVLKKIMYKTINAIVFVEQNVSIDKSS